MEGSIAANFYIGSWSVHPASGELSRDSEVVRLDERSMRLLLCLAERAGQVVSIEELLDRVWAGVNVSQDSVYQAVATLRRTLGDDPKQPAYIATVPRLGYRMVAEVRPGTEVTVAPEASPVVAEQNPEPAAAASTKKSNVLTPVLVLVLVVLCGAGLGAYFYNRQAAHHQAVVAAQLREHSVAVLPILDLTEGMKNEEFADGVTEELIDKISKLSGFRVPSPTASFYYKGKQVPVAEVAKSLGVAYVLDGSVRQSEGWVRVDVRLVHAENSYVLWSESYDQPMGNIIAIQGNIAGEVSKALKARIDKAP